MQKNLHRDICNSFIHNCQNLEATEILSSVGEWINKLIHPDNEILFRTKKELSIKLWKDMEET